jgi:EpsI family protein
MSAARALFIVALLAGTTAFAAARTQPAPIPAALDALPLTIGRWHGVASTPFDVETRRQLAADAYLTRTYRSADTSSVDLYVAYYAQQRPNVSIHSPLHCLPSTGWEPLDVSTVDLARDEGASLSARRMVVRKGLDRALVLYWYAIHGRVVANEVSSRLYLLHDSLLDGRSDAALVRVAVPIAGTIDAADRDAVAFARALLPRLTF